MKQQDTYVGWDFLSIWEIDEDTTYPSLKEMKVKVVTWVAKVIAADDIDGGSIRR